MLTPQRRATHERGHGLTEDARCATPSTLAGRPHTSRSACACTPARGARPTRRRGASEQGSGARGATDGTNETIPNPQRRPARERGRGPTESARRADSPGRLTARVALSVRPRAPSWCAPYRLAQDCKARERRAGGDGLFERNDSKPPTKSGALTRPRNHRGRVARGLPASAYRARRARCTSARPLVVRALPAGVGPRSERAACAGRRTGQTKRRPTPNKERRVNAAAESARARGAWPPRANRTHAATDGTNETTLNPQ